MANKNLFYAGKMASQQLDVYLAGAVVLDANDEPIEAPDGGLVELGDLVADDTYSATGLQYDVYEAKAATTDYKDLALIDYAGVQEGEIGGNEYKIGDKLYGLKVPAGVVTRVRRPHLHDKFWLGDDNYDTVPTLGDHYGVDTGKFTHAKIAAEDVATHTGYMVKIVCVRELTVGHRSNGGQYLNEVKAL
jgi:hypothetical protein